MHFTDSAIWRNTGLKITTEKGVLVIEDLNPDAKIRNRVSRWELFRIGFWLIRKSFSRA